MDRWMEIAEEDEKRRCHGPMARTLASGFVKWATNMTTLLHVGSIGRDAREASRLHLCARGN